MATIQFYLLHFMHAECVSVCLTNGRSLLAYRRLSAHGTSELSCTDANINDDIQHVLVILLQFSIFFLHFSSSLFVKCYLVLNANRTYRNEPHLFVALECARQNKSSDFKWKRIQRTHRCSCAKNR